MAVIYDDIRASLEDYLANTAGIPSGIAYENTKFSPTTGTPYLKTLFVPTLRRPANRGINPQMRYQGVFTIEVYAPENLGPGAADAIANTLIERFEATTDITYNSKTISIDYAERQQGITDSPWYFIPIDIGWYIYD